MNLVKNLNKTSNRTPPSEYLSWKQWWVDKTGRSFPSCSCSGCNVSAAVGAHVQKSGANDMKWYIVPLCIGCNNKPSTEVFYVRDYDLVWVEA